MGVEIEFDPQKDRTNVEKHGISLMAAAELFMSDYVERTDSRHESEDRRIATGHIRSRLMVCVYTWRHDRRRIISLRKANKREQRKWLQNM